MNAQVAGGLAPFGISSQSNWGGRLALRGRGRLRCFGQTSSSSPSGAAGAAHACILHTRGLDLRKMEGFCPWKFIDRLPWWETASQ